MRSGQAGMFGGLCYTMIMVPAVGVNVNKIE